VNRNWILKKGRLFALVISGNAEFKRVIKLDIGESE